MRILDLTLIAVGTYNPLHRRSYKVHVDGVNMNKLHQVTNDGTNITYHQIAQVAPDIIRPSAEASSAINIVNGWGEERYRFVLHTVEKELGGSTEECYYIGYTDRARDSVSMGGHIDPTLQFHVTSSQRFTTRRVMSNIGGPHHSLANDTATQFLYGSGSISSLGNSYESYHCLRPYEVFRNQTMANHWRNMGIMDSNTIDTTGSLSVHGAKSQRRNNVSGSYLYDFLKAFKSGVDVSRERGEGYDIGTISEEASGVSMENDIYSDQFLSQITLYAQNAIIRGQFSFTDLNKLCPYIDQVTTVVKHSPFELSEGWSSANTCHWHGSDNATIAATMIVNALPTIMLETLVSMTRFTITNMTADGSIAYAHEKLKMMNDSLDIGLAERMMQRLILEVINHISQQGLIPFNILIESSIYGDTLVNISLNGQPHVPYVMPSFADNMASPVIMENNQAYAQNIDSLFAVGDNLLRPSNPMQRGVAIAPTSVNATGPNALPVVNPSAYGNQPTSGQQILAPSNTGVSNTSNIKAPTGIVPPTR